MNNNVTMPSGAENTAQAAHTGNTAAAAAQYHNPYDHVSPAQQTVTPTAAASSYAAPSSSYTAPSAYTASSAMPGSTSSGYSNPYTPQYTPNDFQPKKKKNGKKWALSVAAICAALVISGGAFYAGVAYNAGTSDGSGGLTSATSQTVANGTTVNISQDNTTVSSTITEVVDQAMPSMVAINTITEESLSGAYGYFYHYMFGDDYDQTYETSASGSGIIIGQNDTELLIVTNNHVIEGADTIAVQFIDDQSYDATIKGTAADNDLAVIAVKLSDISADTLDKIKVATLGNSENLKLGEPAIAIGNSLGYGQSVTVGYISALEREVQISDRTMTLIQTDAAINPGNSGGALLNIKGEVIGINSAKYSDTDVEGTGYAIPISDAEPIINDLISGNTVSDEDKPYLGIYGQDVPEAYQDKFSWPQGVYVSQVTNGSPASLAGVQAGDIITSLNGEKVDTMDTLQSVLAKCKAGDKIAIEVYRTGKDSNSSETQTLTATLISRGDAESLE